MMLPHGNWIILITIIIVIDRLDKVPHFYVDIIV